MKPVREFLGTKEEMLLYIVITGAQGDIRLTPVDGFPPQETPWAAAQTGSAAHPASYSCRDKANGMRSWTFTYLASRMLRVCLQHLIRLHSIFLDYIWR